MSGDDFLDAARRAVGEIARADVAGAVEVWAAFTGTAWRGPLETSRLSHYAACAVVMELRGPNAPDYGWHVDHCPAPAVSDRVAEAMAREGWYPEPPRILARDA